MKSKVLEFDGCFTVELEPETLTDASALIRFRVNATKELRGNYLSAYRDGSISASIVFGKRVDPETYVRGGR